MIVNVAVLRLPICTNQRWKPSAKGGKETELGMSGMSGMSNITAVSSGFGCESDPDNSVAELVHNRPVEDLSNMPTGTSITKIEKPAEGTARSNR